MFSNKTIVTVACGILLGSLIFEVTGLAQDPVPSSITNYASGSKAAIATGCPQAAQAGLQMLKSGGNAFDAAVATMLVQTVIEEHLFCFGSEVPIIVYDQEREVVEVIVGLGAAPQLATPKWFNENRNGVIQGRGDIANCNVPGLLDALLTMLDRYGSKTFTECSAAMLQILSDRAGMEPDKISRRIKGYSTLSDADWLKHHQNFLKTIERLRAAEAAAGTDRVVGLRAVSDYFYRGPIAQEIDTWSRNNGGLLRFSDFAAHHTRIESPQQMDFRGHTIYKCGVWTQGPFLHQTLRLIEDRELETLDHDGSDYVHLVTEAMKLAFADRDAFYADPAFTQVPMEALMSDEYTKLRRELIDMKTASQEQQAGDPLNMKSLLGVAPQDHQVFAGHSDDTSNCLVADEAGNIVAATPSGWGGVEAGDTGVQLGSRMIGLVTWDNHPSMVQPGKRPRITLTPTLIFKDRKPVFAISVAGGDQQDQASIQILLNRLVFNFDAKKSATAPRFSTEHHINWFGHLPCKPGTLTIPPRSLSRNVQSELLQRGHQISAGRSAGAATVLAIDVDSGQKEAATDRGKFGIAW